VSRKIKYQDEAERKKKESNPITEKKCSAQGKKLA